MSLAPVASDCRLCDSSRFFLRVGHLHLPIAYASSSTLTLANSCPSSIDKLAPPPVLTCETSSLNPICLIAAALSPPPMMLVSEPCATAQAAQVPCHYCRQGREMGVTACSQRHTKLRHLQLTRSNT
jgi:hypothetical protein